MNRLQIALIAAGFSIAAPLAAIAAPMALTHGTFTSGVHETTGTATILHLDSGKTILRLTNFATSNGPKVHVVLTDHVVMGNKVTDAHSIDLGDLHGTSGNQNYVIPSGTDLSKIKAVSIYCERFHVNFGSATLK